MIEPGEFMWAAGIEDTFVAAPHPRTGRVLDEYALTEHYERWEHDLELLAGTGVRFARYGIPWYRANPAPGVYDWAWADRVLGRMVGEHRIEPIVDLVHYGTPLWMERAFLEPDYPKRLAEYAAAFAERYRGLCHWYTPLNEPRVNAWYAGRIGWWPPYGRSRRTYLRVLAALCRSICLAEEAIRAVDSDALFVHVDASDLYLPADPDDELLAKSAAEWQELVYLPLDLVTGRVDSAHCLGEWMRQNGLSDDEIEWFSSHAARPDIIGFNMYPMFSRKIVRRTRHGVRVRIQRCWTETLEEVARQYAARYGLPVMITETACDGSFARRVSWVEESIALARKLRDDGVDLRGYTFWPLFSLIGWAYTNGRRDVGEYLYDIGLWDLRPGPTGLERVESPVAEAFRRAVARGI